MNHHTIIFRVAITQPQHEDCVAGDIERLDAIWNPLLADPATVARRSGGQVEFPLTSKYSHQSTKPHLNRTERILSISRPHPQPPKALDQVANFTMATTSTSSAAATTIPTFQPGDRVIVKPPYQTGRWVIGNISHHYVEGQAVEVELDPQAMMGVSKQALKAVRHRLGCLVFPELVENVEHAS
ncbi:hypothetical protein M409DRAFT_53159 [Zasmidium cellare ATCC 36951]|uniref:Uncharacterized protein n=1 Tax=Zasmidium cellare ATCC 36951 TaxID=1080233 RepID=A0A6A6CPA0_ZASCE|nr:uncharacterized protein M409DRAFT_53159 [Zasmidium cellare ATCC 36951]KAF2168493.1 hypothetical protein M409DRAFT_53159 [Zasmidium cellare ATCC 36951]